MVAKPSAMYETANVIDMIETRLQDMEQFVESGEWDRIDRIVRGLPQLIARVPMSRRRDVVVAARASVEHIRERAAQKSHEISQRLATIRTGRKAAESYRTTSAMPIDSPSPGATGLE